MPTLTPYAFLTIVVAALVSLAAIPQQEGPYVKDEHAFCWNKETAGTQGKRYAQDKNAHECACRLRCQLDANGNVVGEHEDSTCGLYCKQERCFCHRGEEPCEKPSGVGLVDMDGTVVAIARRNR